MGYPDIRMRRLRSSETMRRLVRETSLSADDLIYPLFVKLGEGVKEPIASLKGSFHFSPDTIVTEAKEVASLGIPAVILFGVAGAKDENGSEAWAEDGAVQLAIKNIKQAVPGLLVATDVCLCAYTESGHCGVTKDEKIDNDATCKLLAKMALSHAQAGADIVGPSDMMDGRVGYIRQTLEENGFDEVAIMSYSAKYASAFYGPFRDVADSTPAFGDRRSYQMDAANIDQAIEEVAQDIEEGADIVMVKPALCYLDVICQVRAEFDCPVAAYFVSGEYMMLHAAADAGLLELERAMLEVHYAMKRAGAGIIITYYAKELAKFLG
ncbi:MAG: porphobilinogen synthase [Planctomycetes bacterium]|nr:porphobilinogen synthase [Planctomycetota bacterium]